LGSIGRLDLFLEEAGYRRECEDSDRLIYRQAIQVNRMKAAVA
jgi:hypothetical protein